MTMATSKKKRKAITSEASESITDAVLRAARPGADYSNVVAAANLEAVRLIRATFELAPEFDSVYPNPEALAAGRLGFGGELKTSQLNAETGVAIGLFSWWIEANHGEKQLLNLNASYAITYTGLMGRDADAVRRFIDRVGRFAIYPYFRALASQFSWASETNLPILPLLRENEQQPSAARPLAMPEDAGPGGMASSGS